MSKLTTGILSVHMVAMAKLTNSKKPQMVAGKPFIQLGKWTGYTPDRSRERVSIWAGG
jgi:hypothetical protein